MTRNEMVDMLDDYCCNVMHCPGCSDCPAGIPNGPDPYDCKPWADYTDSELEQCIARLVGEVPNKSDKPDMVNSPKHYDLPSGLEVIDIEIATQGKAAVMSHCVCSALEYLLRHKKKNGAEDVRKAHWWLSKYVELEAME